MFTSKVEKNLHSAGIWSCSWKGDTIMTGSVEDMYRVKTFKTGADGSLHGNRQLHGHDAAVISVSLNSTGKIGASTGLDGYLNVWDFGGTSDNIDEKTILKHHIRANEKDKLIIRPWATKICPLSNKVVICGQSGLITEYDLETGQIQKESHPTEMDIALSVTYSNDGNLLACGSSNGLLVVMDTRSNDNIIDKTMNLPIRSISFSPDNLMVAAACDDKQIHILDLGISFNVGNSDKDINNKIVGICCGHRAWAVAVDWSPEGKYLVSGSVDKTVKLWNPSTQDCLHTFNDHKNQVWDVCFGAEDSDFISVGDDGYIVKYSYKS